MPTKKRTEREKQLEAQRLAIDTALENPPDHVIARQAAKRLEIETSSPLSEKLVTQGQHNAGWAKFDERGQNVMREDPDELGANSYRHSKKIDDALDIRDRHRNEWGKRGTAKRIAHKEGLSVETIRRYMKAFPIYG